MELTRNPPARARLPFTVAALVRQLRRIGHGSLDVEHDGRVVSLTGRDTGPVGHLQLHRPGQLLSRLATRGDIGFAESYMAGDWDSEDLAAPIPAAAAGATSPTTTTWATTSTTCGWIRA